MLTGSDKYFQYIINSNKRPSTRHISVSEFCRASETVQPFDFLFMKPAEFFH